MEVKLSFEKTVQQNAALYFEKSKKAKKKLSGLEKAIPALKAQLEKTKLKKVFEKKPVREKRKKNWFEKFHWFFSSDGFLAISGRDAKSNEELIKKHLSKNDLFFHADIRGAPHTILKEGIHAPEKTLEETACFAATYSRAWKDGLPSIDVYSVNSDSVTKSAPSGESIGTGAFMVYGKRKWFKKTPLAIAVGMDKEKKVVAGPPSAIKKNSDVFAQILQGKETKGNIAKKIFSEFKKKGAEPDLDELISMFPSGGLELKKEK
jgi:predicted ribosome quality control (RQC) complex YloA/Tae2 family protein